MTQKTAGQGGKQALAGIAPPARRRRLTPEERVAAAARLQKLHEQIVAKGRGLRSYRALMREVAKGRGGVG